MPRFMASRGVAILTGAPSTRISPASARCTPERMLISVDFPAPLSPTRPSASPRLKSSVTPFSACTPEYHLCRLRTEMMASLVIALRLHLDRAGAPAHPGISDDGEDGEHADCELEPVSVNLRKHQPVVDDTDQRRADDAAGDRADAAIERHAADDGRRHGLQLQSLTDRRQRRAQPQHLDHAGEARQNRAQHETG